MAAGFADFPLIAYHFERRGSVRPDLVPIFYAAAMGIGGGGSLLFGRLFDRHGLVILVPLTLLGALYAPLVFLGDFWASLAGACRWGLGIGAHESIVPAVVATLVAPERRASAYGLFTGLETAQVSVEVRWSRQSRSRLNRAGGRRRTRWRQCSNACRSSVVGCLGRELVPTGVVPLTSVVTAIGPGQRDRLLIRHLDGSQREAPLADLADYVTEASNLHNRFAVRAQHQGGARLPCACGRGALRVRRWPASV